MDLNAAAAVFMGGYVVVIVIAALVMSLRPGAGTVALIPTGAAASGAAGCAQAILLGGDAEVLGNFRGRVQSVLLGPRTGRLEQLTLESGGGVLEGGRVPAGAIVAADGRSVQLAEPWVEPATEVSSGAITLQGGAAVFSRDGKRLGKLRLVCFDQPTGVVTGLIVVAGWRSGRTVRLPIARVKAAGPERVATDLQSEEWLGLQAFADDRTIHEAVLQRLEEDPTTRPLVRSVTVEVENQQVRLGGYVRSEAEAEAVAAVARSVPAVVAVHRDLQSDEDLVRAVREAISRDLGNSATDLDVRSEFGQVDILGQVRDRTALRRIDAVAGRVPGVLVMHNFATVA